MGNKNSNEKGNRKNPYSELLIKNNLYSINDLKNDNKNENNNNDILDMTIDINDLIKEFLYMKKDQRKMVIEINHLKEKNQKLESELNKIQTNYGHEIFNLLEYCSVLQKDIENIMNNQRIISDFLQTNGKVN